MPLHSIKMTTACTRLFQRRHITKRVGIQMKSRQRILYLLWRLIVHSLNTHMKPKNVFRFFANNIANGFHFIYVDAAIVRVQNGFHLIESSHMEFFLLLTDWKRNWMWHLEIVNYYNKVNEKKNCRKIESLSKTWQLLIENSKSKKFERWNHLSQMG